MKKVMMFAIGAMLLASASTAMAGNLYWGETKSGFNPGDGTEFTWVQRADLDGNNLATLATGYANPSAQDFNGLAVDGVNGEIYYADPNTGGGTIHRMSLTGTPDATPLTGTGVNGDIAADPAGGNIYWGYGSGLRSGDLGLAAITGTLAMPGLGVDVNNAGGKVYGAAGGIETADLALTSSSPLATPVSLFSYDVKLDVAGNKMYYTDIFGTGDIWQADLSGGTPTVLLPLPALVTGYYTYSLALDPAANKIYVGYTNFADSYIYSANLNDGSLAAPMPIIGFRPGLQVRYMDVLDNAPAGVPEPSTFVLAALGLLGLGCVALRRKLSPGLTALRPCNP